MAWLLCISCVEIGLIIFFTRKMGPLLTFWVFATPALAGLLIQWVRWYRLKPLRDDMGRLWNKRIRRGENNKHKNSDLYWKSDEAKAYRQVSRKLSLSDYWLATFLLLLPGFLFHLLAFMFIVSPTRRAAWFLLTCGGRSYQSITEERDAKAKLPSPETSPFNTMGRDRNKL